MKCEVCGINESIGVVNALGPLSLATCRSCIDGGFYPWWNLVGYYCGIRYEDLTLAAQEGIQANLVFHKKTLEEFKAECQELYIRWSADMERYNQEPL